MQNKFTHKIRRLGKYSYGISFPKEKVKDFKWQEHQKVVLVFDDKKKQILIKDWPALTQSSRGRKPKK